MDDTRRVENDAYAAFCRRTVRALGRRVGEGDVTDLRYLRQLREELVEAEMAAIAGLRDQGYSYRDIGAGLGVSGQAIHQQVKAFGCR